MAQLIQLRNRMKAIQTIKKITHAMRLISMSSHTRLKTQEKHLKNYSSTLSKLFARIKKTIADWQHPRLQPKSGKKNLIILVSSQKGLCGNFNNVLFRYFMQQLQDYDQFPEIIVVGHQARNFIHRTFNKPDKIIDEHDKFTSRTALSIAQKITNHILHTEEPYNSVVVISNLFKSFFAQIPTTTNLIPFLVDEAEVSLEGSAEGFLWEQEQTTVLDHLAQQSLEAHFSYLLYQSLLAEQAARFLSMDSSTRNAENLLEKTRLDYNKLRQAIITKELAELTGNI